MKFSFQKITKETAKEFLELCLYLIILAFVLYYIPPPIREYLFLPTLFIAWKSKKDYFWIAFFFLITDVPGGLFSGMEKIDPYGLPLYRFGDLTISILELFYLLIFVKVLNQPRKTNQPFNFFKTELSTVSILFLLLLVVTLVMGASYFSLKYLYKTIIYMTLFYSFFRLIDTKEKLFKFFGIMFPFSFVAVLLQLYTLIFKKQVVALFKPGVISAQGVVDVVAGTNVWIRPIEMAHVLLVTFTATLFLISYKKHYFNKNYLLIINLISFFGILLTGTRSWILALAAGYIYFFVIMYKQTKDLLRWIVISFALIFLLVNFMPVLEKQVEVAWSRFLTIEDLAEGDITAGGTMQRLDVREHLL